MVQEGFAIQPDGAANSLLFLGHVGRQQVTLVLGWVALSHLLGERLGLLQLILVQSEKACVVFGVGRRKADLLQLFEAFANQSGTAGVIGPFEALHKGLSTDTLMFFILAGVDQNNQEFSKLRFKVGILDQQRQLA